MQPLLKRYLETIVHKNKTIDARGVMQVQRIIELELEEIFISLTAPESVNENETIFFVI
jgi:hypothetical protein